MAEFDIIVVGAGIHGAGIAQAASAQGYSCLVLEQFGQPAEGTSSRSSKLIHGGLRYLETGQLPLVRECLREQRLLIKNAPDLVHYIPFYIPIYSSSSRPAWKIRLGLMLYRLLGGREFRKVPRSEWQAMDGINTQHLKTVFQYWDAQTDDRNLTEAVLHSARGLGCQAVFHATVKSASRIEDGYIVQWTDAQHAPHEEHARILINATGPWANHLLSHVSPQPPKLETELVAGTHIVLDKTSSNQIYYLEAPQDQRAVFVMPWRGKTLIGTTERSYTGKPEDIEPSEEEIQYLLDVYHHYFQSSAEETNLLDAFAGLRVLPKTDGAAFQRPRETVFSTDTAKNPRLFTIYGGKLTAYRATAEKLMRRLTPVLGKKTSSISTKSIQLDSSGLRS